MSRCIRAVVVDDEPMALTRLSRLLRDQDDFEVVAECGDGASAIAALRSHCPDVAFLDIHMPEVDGLQVSANAAVGDMCIVYVTAHSEHAVRAFETDAVDYLLKPFSVRRLQATLARLRARVVSQKRAFPEHLLLQAGARQRLVPVQSIDSLLASDNYVEVHCGRERYRETSPIKRETFKRSTPVEPIQWEAMEEQRRRPLSSFCIRDASERCFDKAAKCSECRHTQCRVFLALNHAIRKKGCGASNRRACP